MGVVRECIVSLTWSSYKTYLPLVSGVFAMEKARLDKQLDEIDQKLAVLSPDNLRNIANQYTVSFLQTISTMLLGEDKLDFPGQTLMQEIEEQGKSILLFLKIIQKSIITFFFEKKKTRSLHVVIINCCHRS